MQIIEDKEFGEIKVRRVSRASSIRIRVHTDGSYIASAPKLTPLFIIKQVINTSRPEIRKLKNTSRTPDAYRENQPIGKSHQLAVVETGMVKKPEAKVSKQKLLVYLPPGQSLDSKEAQKVTREAVIKILRTEAKAYLPRRLKHLAEENGFNYERVRFSHASGRWGSCSSAGTISLNIALMKLPHELIDYVLIHELSHTVHMNHSDAFWKLVEKHDPFFKVHRKLLKRETPSV